jgi:cytochrome c oxidase subunit III
MSVVIPYIDEPRPDTGVTNAKLAIWLFLASEVMLFGGLFSAYIVLRVNNPEWLSWASVLNVPMATLNTFILITSSITVVLSWASLMRRDFAKYRMYTIITLLCGLGFMVVKYFEYTAKFHHGLYPSSNPFLSIYFVLTGLHGLHVVGGMAALAWLCWPGSKLYHKNPKWFAQQVECAGLFWHLVDLVWIVLFPVLYLM